MKIVDAINTEDLIYVIEKYRAIWDTHAEGYSNKLDKKDAWENVIIQFFPDFEERLAVEKHEITLAIQRKWKSIRTCYSRELLKKKSEKNSPRATGRKQYMYFDQLRFLETLSKSAAANAADDYDGESSTSEPTNLPDEIILPNSNSKNCWNKRKSEGDGLTTTIKQEMVSDNEMNTSDLDEDKLFLLSLVPDMGRVPQECKLKLKSDILMMISHAQQMSSYHQT